MRRPSSLRARSAAAVLALVLAGCGSSTQGDSAEDEFSIAFAGALKGDPTHDAIADVTESLAAERGWEYTFVNNNVDGPTAVQNAKLLANKGVDAVIEFQIDPTVMPKISQIFAAEGITWISYSVPGPGAYFVGTSDEQAGVSAGRSLGEFAKREWDCRTDLVILLTAPTLPGPNQRVVKVPEGFKEVCPDVPASAFVERDSDGGDSAKAQEATRNVLVANPDAERILIAGLTDQGVTMGLTAAKQLGRYEQTYAWGQGGDQIAGEPDPHLLGSVMYFLEGFPAYAMTVLDQIAAGEPAPKGEEDDASSSTAVLTGICSLTREEGMKLPSLEERADRLLEESGGTTLDELYCPEPSR